MLIVEPKKMLEEQLALCTKEILSRVIYIPDNHKIVVSHEETHKASGDMVFKVEMIQTIVADTDVATPVVEMEFDAILNAKDRLILICYHDPQQIQMPAGDDCPAEAPSLHTVKLEEFLVNTEK